MMTQTTKIKSKNLNYPLIQTHLLYCSVNSRQKKSWTSTIEHWRITTPEFLKTYSVKIISFSISLYCVWQQLIRDNLWPWKQQLKVNILYSRATLHTGQVISGLTSAVWGITFLLELCVLQIVSDTYHGNSLMPELGQLIWCPCYLKRFFNQFSEQICGINSVLMSASEHNAKLGVMDFNARPEKMFAF